MNPSVIVDISDRKRAEAEFRAMFNLTGVGMAQVDIKTRRFLRVNATLCAITGYTEAELLALTVDDINHPNDRDRDRDHDINLLHGDSYQSEKRYLRKDGSTVWVLATGNIIRDAAGQPLRAFAMIQDISDRQAAAATLRASEERYRLVFEHNPNPMWFYDPETLAFLEVNQAAIAHYGYSRSEFLQMTIADIRPPTDVPALRQVNNHLVPGQPDIGVWQHCKKDRSLIDVKVTAYAFPVAGKQANLVLIEDITELKRLEAERQQAEAALQETHQRIVTNWESMTDAYTLLDREWRIVYANSTSIRLMCQLTNLEPENILGKSHWEIFPWTIGQSIEREYRRAVAQQVPVHLEVLYEPTGNWFEFHAYPSPVGLGLYFRDISDRKQLEIALQSSEEKLRLALDLNTIGIWEWHIATGVVFWNASHYIVLGYQPGEIEPSYQRWRDRVHPDDIEFAEQKIIQALETHADYEAELRLVLDDGSIRWLHSKGRAVYDEAGQPVRMVGVEYDITDRKLAAEKIREQAALLDIASDAIFVRDLDQRILYWNQGAERLYGWTATEAIAQRATELLQEDAAQVSEIMQTLFDQRQWQGEIRKVTKTGKQVIVEGRWTLVSDDAGQPKFILSVNTDITEKKQLEAQFLRAQRLESIGTLASGIAHDLNNILTPILTVAQLLPLRLRGLDESTQRLLEILETNVKQGADLVQQILAFARGSEGQCTTLQVRHLLAEIAKIAKQTFPKSIEIRTQVSTKELWLVDANASQLHQAILNLCVNARDAMPDGGTLTIVADNCTIGSTFARGHLDARVGSYVKIAIADTGTGIVSDVFERMFDPFFTTKELGKGTGLGLSTVQSIIKNHGGFIDVTTQAGQGTSFTVYLPASEHSETPALRASDSIAGNDELILVVDDEAAIGETIKVTLETHHYRVLVAQDGIEAIALYAQHQDDISMVLLDLMMPSFDGFKLIAALPKLNPHVRIVAMSGLTSNEEKLSASDRVQAFVAKPFTTEDLLTAIGQVLARASMPHK